MFLFELLVGSDLVSDNVAFDLLRGILDKTVEALPRGIGVAFPRDLKLDKVFVLLFMGNSVTFNSFYPVPAVLLSFFRHCWLCRLLFLVSDVLREPLGSFALTDGSTVLKLDLLFSVLVSVNLYYAISEVTSLLVNLVRRLDN